VPPAGRSFVSGRVVDAAGRPLQTFGVNFYPKTAGTYSTSTFFFAPGGADGDGGYFISVLPGTYRVEFGLRGYTTMWWRNSATADGATDVVVPSAGLTIPGINAQLAVAATPQPTPVTLPPCGVPPCIWGDKTTARIGDLYTMHMEGYAEGTNFTYQSIDPLGNVGPVVSRTVTSTPYVFSIQYVSPPNGGPPTYGVYVNRIVILETTRVWLLLVTLIQ
jgi:hypothetical protein